MPFLFDCLIDIDFTMPLLEEEENGAEQFTGKTASKDTKIGEDEEPERWLETMGAEQSEIKRLQNSQVVFCSAFKIRLKFIIVYDRNKFLEWTSFDATAKNW